MRFDLIMSMYSHFMHHLESTKILLLKIISQNQNYIRLLYDLSIINVFLSLCILTINISVILSFLAGFFFKITLI